MLRPLLYVPLSFVQPLQVIQLAPQDTAATKGTLGIGAFYLHSPIDAHNNLLTVEDSILREHLHRADLL